MPSSDARRVPVGAFVTVHEASAAPTVTIVMPVYEQAPFVADAVRSVLDQREVVAEIILSDDGSTDMTFETALAAVDLRLAAHDVAHRIVVRRGDRPLRRGHVHTLVDRASCDIVVVAHGDDIARHDRAARLLAALDATGAAMAASRCDLIDAWGHVTDTAGEHPDAMLTLEEALDGQPWLIGATQAWRRSALSAFGPMTSATAPVGQDRVLAARAWWCGGIVAVGAPLLRRRLHDRSWNRSQVDATRPDASAFGLALMRACMVDAMLDDVARAESLGLATPQQAESARQLLTRRRAHAGQDMRGAYATLEADGLTPIWLDDTERRLAADGTLVRRLRRRAALSAPLRVAARSTRRITGR